MSPRPGPRGASRTPAANGSAHRPQQTPQLEQDPAQAVPLADNPARHLTDPPAAPHHRGTHPFPLPVVIGPTVDKAAQFDGHPLGIGQKPDSYNPLPRPSLFQTRKLIIKQAAGDRLDETHFRSYANRQLRQVADSPPASDVFIPCVFNGNTILFVGACGNCESRGTRTKHARCAPLTIWLVPTRLEGRDRHGRRGEVRDD